MEVTPGIDYWTGRGVSDTVGARTPRVTFEAGSYRGIGGSDEPPSPVNDKNTT